MKKNRNNSFFKGKQNKITLHVKIIKRKNIIFYFIIII
jgi:hypothetical protein